MLNENCMLVSLSISLPPQTRIAQEASDKVEREYATKRRQGRVVKQLFDDKDIQPMTVIVSQARAMFNSITLPYDTANRIMPSSNYFTFLEKMRPFSQKFDTAKHEFIADLPNIKLRAEAALGALYDDADYPSAEYLQGAIKMTLDASVVPPMNAFDKLAGLTPEAIEQLKQDAVSAQKSKIESALGDLFKRLFTSLYKAQRKLSDEDRVFRNTLISNIYDSLEDIDSLNLTGDPDLIEMAAEVRQALVNVTPEKLRNDKDLRKQTAEQTQQLLDKVREFF